jgi:putative PIN family toxin of toxin-antitoxin system
MRIILDTNLRISFLISSNYEKLDEVLFNQKCKLLFSLDLLEKFVAFDKYPKLRKDISRDELEDIFETIDEVADFVNVSLVMTINGLVYLQPVYQLKSQSRNWILHSDTRIPLSKILTTLLRPFAQRFGCYTAIR